MLKLNNFDYKKLSHQILAILEKESDEQDVVHEILAATKENYRSPSFFCWFPIRHRIKELGEVISDLEKGIVTPLNRLNHLYQFLSEKDTAWEDTSANPSLLRGLIKAAHALHPAEFQEIFKEEKNFENWLKNIENIKNFKTKFLEEMKIEIQKIEIVIEETNFKTPIPEKAIKTEEFTPKRPLSYREEGKLHREEKKLKKEKIDRERMHRLDQYLFFGHLLKEPQSEIKLENNIKFAS